MYNGIERMAGYVDFVCSDQISKIEILTMAKQFNIDVERCSIWWLDGNVENRNFREIVTDVDTLAMAKSVDSSKEVHVRINIRDTMGMSIAEWCGTSGVGCNIGWGAKEGSEDEEDTGVDDLGAVLTGKISRGRKGNEEMEINDSDYNYDDDSDEEVDGDRCLSRSLESVSE